MSLPANSGAVVQELDPAAISDSSSTEVLKISTHSRPNAAAGAIAGVIRGGHAAEIQVIGAGATHQAVKAIAIACNYLREERITIVCVPSFTDVVIDGEERTAMRLLVERHQPA